MLVPRFTLRHALFLVALLGVYLAIAAFAVQGQLWATAIAVGSLSLVVVFVLHAVLYLLTSMLAALAAIPQGIRTQTPFAEDRPPPQLVQPQRPDTD